MYRPIRYEIFISIFNMLIAPFGNVKFKTYLLAEILTDCMTVMQDTGLLAYYLDTSLWNTKFSKLNDPNLTETNTLNGGIKWTFYCLTFLPYMWRMNQNLRKWLVYNHGLQAFNALKYCILMLSSVFAIIYYEAHIYEFKYLYYSFKVIGCLYKYCWDCYYDWGLFHGTMRQNRFLRDQTKLPSWFYYFSIVYNLIGLFSWALSILLLSALTKPINQSDREMGNLSDAQIQYNQLSYYNKVMGIMWLEFLLVVFRRLIWVIIRIENEFFNNFEQFRDIVTIPPIKFDE